MIKKDIIHISILCGLFFIGFFGVVQIYGESEKKQEAEITAKEATSTMLFVGDIMLSRDVARQIKKYKDSVFPFRFIASTTRTADFVFGNLEGPISDKGENQGSIYSFRAEPDVINGLLYAGFNAVSLANNHIFDWGRVALTDTVERLNGAGIKTIGAGKNETEANAPIITNIKDTKVVILAYTNLYPQSFWAKGKNAGISRFIKSEILEKIKELRSDANILVVSVHWGNEYEMNVNEMQRELGRSFIDAGADIVVGHHPHVVQELEQYKNGWIAYSLGNFIFDQNFSDDTQTGAMLEIKLRNQHIESVNKKIIEINDEYQPKERQIVL